MKMKLITSLIATSLLTLSAHAMPPKPEKCPEASALKTVSLEAVEKEDDGTWAAGVLSNNYDTKDKWTFVIGKIDATDASDAKNKAIEAMTSLEFNGGPIAIAQLDKWACLYKNAKNYMSVAVTPSFGMKAITKLAV